MMGTGRDQSGDLVRGVDGAEPARSVPDMADVRASNDIARAVLNRGWVPLGVRDAAAKAALDVVHAWEAESADKPHHRILWNERDDDIDEVVIVEPQTVHVEQMSDRCWWIGIYLDADRYWMGNFIADSRGRMRFTEQENAGVEWTAGDDCHAERKAARVAEMEG